jgi:hypothetical protein
VDESPLGYHRERPRQFYRARVDLRYLQGGDAGNRKVKNIFRGCISLKVNALQTPAPRRKPVAEPRFLDAACYCSVVINFPGRETLIAMELDSRVPVNG